MQQILIESYKQTELAKKVQTATSRIKKDKWLYIPIKIETAQTRANKKWFTVRYVRAKDILDYLKVFQDVWRKAESFSELKWWHYISRKHKER